jgi:diacylglycerol kinase family enzyme
MQPPLFIINPACGTRGAAQEISSLLTRVSHLYGDVTVRYTERRGHATELALAGVDAGHSLIVAVGGDGTFSEVVNGVRSADDKAELAPPGVGTESAPAVAGTGHATAGAGAGRTEVELPAVGLVSVGTGGDFRRTLGIGPGIDGSLEALALARDRLIDVARAEFRDPDGALVRRYFVNVLSAGLGGLVDRYIDSLPSFVPGRIGYYLAALRAVAVSRERQVRVRVEWQEETREETVPAYLVAICNGRWFGGGMDVAPMALPDDGRLEVITVTAPNKPYILKRIQSVYAGRHLEVPTVHHFPCARIELRLEDRAAESQFLLDVDGDALGSLPLAVEVVPRRLRVRA